MLFFFLFLQGGFVASVIASDSQVRGASLEQAGKMRPQKQQCHIKGCEIARKRAVQEGVKGRPGFRESAALRANGFAVEGSCPERAAGRRGSQG